MGDANACDLIYRLVYTSTSYKMKREFPVREGRLIGGLFIINIIIIGAHGAVLVEWSTRLQKWISVNQA